MCGDIMVGSAKDALGNSHAYFWSVPGAWIDISGYLPEGYFSSSVNCIDVVGDEINIVGSAGRIGGGGDLFLWHYSPDTVPEPSSLLALGAGAVSLMALRRRR